ncbi:MAG: hypothetical protein A2X32_08625 [Elusimicrobia bacterium GWC2_64_44]|nr:MAG: hypothetical protein A2X32_08625 [Elusimicrobia bacterium GWC2_64_44]
MTPLPLALALLAAAFAAQPAAAAPHTLEARVSNGRAAYRQTIRLTEGRQASHVGPLNGKELILNALLLGGGEYALQYQLELSGGRGAQGRSVQVQSEVALKPGEPLTALECGPWTVVLTLDPSKETPAKAGKAWSTGGLPNYRLTADLSSADSRQVCRLVSKAGVQSNAVDSIRQGEKKFGYILNSLFSASGGVFRLQYQVEHNAPSAATPFQLQNEEEIALNKKTSFSGEGYKLDLLLEGPAPGAAKPASKKGYGTVELLQ